jgi:hypothetical protein
MDIIDYPNYTIDRDGIVKNKTTGKILADRINTQIGYRYVSLWKNNKERKFTLHRLLGLHYIPNPENKPYIDHIDRNKLNNDLSNLRWVDGTENNLNSPSQERQTHNIYWVEERKYYKVIIQRYGVAKYCGSAKTIEEAIAIRDSY